MPINVHMLSSGKTVLLLLFHGTLDLGDGWGGVRSPSSGTSIRTSQTSNGQSGTLLHSITESLVSQLLQNVLNTSKKNFSFCL